MFVLPPGARRPLALLLLAALPQAVFAQAALDNPQQYSLDIPSRPLISSITAIAANTGIQIVSSPNTPAIQAPALVGEYTIEQALNQLLHNTSLRWEWVDGRTLRIFPAAEQGAAEQNSMQLGPVRVQGKHDPKDEAYRAAGSVSVITREEMERLPPRNTADLFVSMPGVTANANRQNPGVSINIRGLQDFGRVNVMIDGARQNYQQTGHGANGHVYVDPELLSQVTVSKGPSSTVGGAAMIGGTVNFSTLNPGDIIGDDKRAGARLNATTGTNAYDFSGSLAAATKVGDNLSVLGAVSRKDIGEFEPGRNGQVRSGDDTVLFSGQDQQSLLFKAVASLDAHKVTLSYMGYEANFSTGSQPFIDHDTVTTDIVTLNWQWLSENPLLNLDTKLYHTSTSNDQYRPDRGEGGLGGYSSFDIYYETTTLGGSLQNQSFVQWGEAAGVFTLGGEFFIDKTRPNAQGTTGGSPLWFAGATPEGQRDVFSGFAQYEWNWDIYEAIIGARHDYYRLRGDGMIHSGVVINPSVPNLPPSSSTIYTLFDIDREETQTSPKITLAVNPAWWLKVYASYGEGFRPPAITETMLHGAHVGGMFPYYPNPTLREERSQSVELGANINAKGVLFNDDKLMARLAWFENDVENFMIMAQTMGPADSNAQAWAFVNLVNPVGVSGVEFQADYEATIAAVNVFSNLSLTHLEFDWGDVAYDAFPLGSQIGYPKPVPPAGTFGALWQYSIPPEQKASLSLGLRFWDEQLSLGLRSRYVSGGEGSGAASGGSAWPSYTLHDLWGAWKVNSNITLRASIDNIDDKAYAEAMGAGLVVGPGRTALFTVNLMW